MTTVDATMTVDQQIETIRSLISAQRRASDETDRRGMVLARHLAELKAEGSWLKAHTPTGRGNAATADSDAQFAHWAVEDPDGPMFGIGRGHVRTLLRFDTQRAQFAASTKLELTQAAWQRFEAVTGRAKVLSNRAEHGSNIVAKAVEYATAAGKDTVTPADVTAAAKDVIAEIGYSTQGRGSGARTEPGKARREMAARDLAHRMISAAEQLIELGMIGALDTAVARVSELLARAQADRRSS